MLRRYFISGFGWGEIMNGLSGPVKQIPVKYGFEDIRDNNFMEKSRLC